MQKDISYYTMAKQYKAINRYIFQKMSNLKRLLKILGMNKLTATLRLTQALCPCYYYLEINKYSQGGTQCLKNLQSLPCVEML